MTAALMPTRAERLADHFIRSAGIAAVYVDDAGTISAVDNVGLFAPSDAVFCCAAGNQAKVLTLAVGRIAPGKWGHAEALAAVHAAAAEVGIGLTPLRKVVQRAFAAVAVVNQTIAEMQRTGGMRELNREFKELRRATPGLRYHDFLHDRKAGMLEATARKSH